jgi:hypothetical protein
MMFVKKYIKFGFFVWLWWVGTFIVAITAGIFVSRFNLVSGIILCIGLFIYGFYNSIKCTQAFKKHLQEYDRLHCLFKYHPNEIKKSILYKMKHFYCTNIMANDLAKEFKIKLD